MLIEKDEGCFIGFIDIVVFVLIFFFDLQELYDSLEKLRLNLFRFVSDIDEKDNEVISMFWFIVIYLLFILYRVSECFWRGKDKFYW